MANAFVRLAISANTGGSTSTSLVTGHPSVSTTAGNLLVVVLGFSGGTVNANSVTDSAGNTYTRADRATSTSYWTSEIWYSFNAAAVSSASGTWTVNASGSVDIGIDVLEYSGLGAGSVSTTGNAKNSSGTTLAVSTSGSAVAGDLVVTSWCQGSGVTASISAGNLRDAANQGSNPGVADADILSASSGTQSFTWTSSVADNKSACIACFTPAAGGQDTPELYGRPAGLRGGNQMRQLLAS